MWPEDLLLPLSLAVAGHPWGSSDRETVRQFETGELRLTGAGVWYDAPDENGLRKLYLYPSPSGGDTLEVEWVYQAVALSTDTPTGQPSEFPEWWHPKLLHFIGEGYFATVEDNPELAEYHKGKADLAVSDLIRYDNERQAGDGIFLPGIAGVTA